MKKVLFATAAVLFAAQVSAQDSIIPLDYMATSAEQYYKYEQNFIDCTNWYIDTPLTQPGTEMPRQIILQFLGTWIDATPTVYVELNEDVMCFCGESPELTIAYLMGYASTLLEMKKTAGTLNTAAKIGNNKDEELAGTVGGILMAGKFYETNKDELGRNRNLDKFLKMHSEGTLTEHIKGLIK